MVPKELTVLFPLEGKNRERNNVEWFPRWILPFCPYNFMWKTIHYGFSWKGKPERTYKWSKMKFEENYNFSVCNTWWVVIDFHKYLR